MPSSQAFAHDLLEDWAGLIDWHRLFWRRNPSFAEPRMARRNNDFCRDDRRKSVRRPDRRSVDSGGRRRRSANLRRTRAAAHDASPIDRCMVRGDRLHDRSRVWHRPVKKMPFGFWEAPGRISRNARRPEHRAMRHSQSIGMLPVMLLPAFARRDRHADRVAHHGMGSLSAAGTFADEDSLPPATPAWR